MHSRLILLILILIPAVTAAHWESVSLKHNWDLTSQGFCVQPTQCLVRTSYNESLDNQPEKYWTGTAYADKPKCIQDKQYLSDNYCENGQWSSRTKLIAQQLLAIAGTNNFALYCDNYQNALNEYQYNTDYGTVTTFLGRYCLQPGNRRTENCANNICAIKYADKVAFGMAINTEINGDKSPLQALNFSKTKCDNAVNPGYNPCGDNVYYNPDTQSIIYAPGVSPMPAVTQTEIDYVADSYEKLKDYVNDYIPAQYNYTYYKITPQFNYLDITKDGQKFFYGFKQENITLPPISYAGWYYSNIQLPDKACDRYIKRYDSRASCEEQPSETDFYIAAYKTSPANSMDRHTSIIDAWQDMTGKLRIYK
ncbi:Uncharacterised protein [uncultured archaeon]|nr:Uncharacterised protein [uncultured archaeon]